MCYLVLYCNEIRALLRVGFVNAAGRAEGDEGTIDGGVRARGDGGTIYGGVSSMFVSWKTREWICPTACDHCRGMIPARLLAGYVERGTKPL